MLVLRYQYLLLIFHEKSFYFPQLSTKYHILYYVKFIYRWWSQPLRRDRPKPSKDSSQIKHSTTRISLLTGCNIRGNCQLPLLKFSLHLYLKCSLRCDPTFLRAWISKGWGILKMRRSSFRMCPHCERFVPHCDASLYI